MQQQKQLNGISLKHRSVTITVFFIMVDFLIHVLLDQCLMWTTCTGSTGISIRLAIFIKCIDDSFVFTC